MKAKSLAESFYLAVSEALTTAPTWERSPMAEFVPVCPSLWPGFVIVADCQCVALLSLR